MYLQDYQRLGGIFLPSKVEKSSLKTVSMYGELHIQGEVYYIKIKHHRGGYIRIVQVCGKTAEDALLAKRKLKELWVTAIQENQCGLRDFINARRLRKSVWMVMLVSCIVCAFMAIDNLMYLGPSMATMFILGFSIVLAFLCIVKRNSIVKERVTYRME